MISLGKINHIQSKLQSRNEGTRTEYCIGDLPVSANIVFYCWSNIVWRKRCIVIIDAYLEASPTFFNGFQIYKAFIVKGMTTTLVTVQPSANVIRDFMINNIMIKANI